MGEIKGGGGGSGGEWTYEEEGILGEFLLVLDLHLTEGDVVVLLEHLDGLVDGLW